MLEQRRGGERDGEEIECVKGEELDAGFEVEFVDACAVKPFL